MMSLGELPEGPRGRLLAAGLLLLAVAALWFGVAEPLGAWFGARQETVARQEVLARHMERIVAGLPALRAAADAGGTNAPVAVLDGGSDAVAGATLQGRLQQIATEAGAALVSTEVLAGEPVGRFRRIGIRITVNAKWPVIVRLLTAIAADPVRLMVDDLRIQTMRSGIDDANPALNVSLIVFGFRAAEMAAR